MTLPRDTNGHGTIFGGHIMSLIDQAGAIAGHTVGGGKLVTVAMREVVFEAPVQVGDLVTCHARVLKVGRTSVTTHVRVVAQSPLYPGLQGEPTEVTRAEVVYVNVDGAGKPLAMPDTTQSLES